MHDQKLSHSQTTEKKIAGNKNFVVSVKATTPGCASVLITQRAL